MKVLLDECSPRRFQSSLVGRECNTVPKAGLAGKKNGELLSSTEHIGFEVFLTMDKGIAYEQNLTGRRIAIIILRSKLNRLIDLLDHASECLALISSIQPGQVMRAGH
jgi:hypothetical protein